MAAKNASSGEVGRVFLKLGLLSFGGPAAHIAMMENELVEKRRWVGHDRFLELVGAANLIPGPTSTELAIYLGYVRAGWPGLVAAGTCFILPAGLIVLILAHLYVEYGMLPQFGAVLYGIKPVIIAVILQAVWKLSRTALQDLATVAVGLAALILFLAAVNPLAVLLVSGLAVAAARRLAGGGLAALPLFAASLPLEGASAGPTGGTMSLGTLFLVFLKIGAILYGSGYVLLAFLWSDFVDGYKVLSAQQLLDAVAVGQFTPGPVFTTATFIGYVIAGLPGAAAATIAIFLPSFLFVPLVDRLVNKLRTSKPAADFLAGVVVASLALMAAVTWTLAAASLVDITTTVIAAAAALLIFFYQFNTTWLIVAGALAGLVRLVS